MVEKCRTSHGCRPGDAYVYMDFIFRLGLLAAAGEFQEASMDAFSTFTEDARYHAASSSAVVSALCMLLSIAYVLME